MSTLPPREMLRQLVAAPSISSVNPAHDSPNRGVIELLAEWCEAQGFRTTIQPLDAAGAKCNLIATLGEGEQGLVLAGHSDTVPCNPDRWIGDPFTLRESEGRLHGLGSCDMKGFFAVALEASRQLSPHQMKRPLHIVATADEESTMNGARQLIDLQARYAVLGEPTGLVPIRAHKGITMQQLKVVGRAGHSSDPTLGRSALEGMSLAMESLLAWRDELQRTHRHAGFEIPYPTLNLGHIRGGDSPNRICGECILDFDLRLVPPMVWQTLRPELEGRLEALLVPRGLSWALNSLDVEVPPFEVPPDAPLVRRVESLSGHPARSVAFASEAPYFQQMGIETVLLGPGEITVAHRPDEYLAIAEMERAIGIVERLIHLTCVEGV